MLRIGKIYKIESESAGLCYYGSTFCDINLRFKKHKYSYTRCGISSGSVLKNNDAKITLVELVPCYSRHDLLIREGWYIENKPCVNTRSAGNPNYLKWSGETGYCYCGGRYKVHNRPNHFGTAKHRRYLTVAHNELNHLDFGYV